MANNLPITMQMGGAAKGVAAVLECVFAVGTDLLRVPPDVKAIPLEMDKVIDIGRVAQVHQGRRGVSPTRCRSKAYPTYTCEMSIA